MKYTIYKIKDYETDEIVYVGCTTKVLKKRLAAHFVDVSRDRPYAKTKAKWFKDSINSGISPKIMPIECHTDKDEALNREKYWIKELNPVLNTIYVNNTNTKSLSEKISDTHSKTIHQYNKDGNFIKSWKSATKAAIALNTCSANISSVAAGKRKLASGFMWRFNKVNKIPKHKIDTFQKEIHKYTMDGIYITSYINGRSVPEVGYKLISKACNNNIGSVYGFKYSFVKASTYQEAASKQRNNSIKI